MSERELQERLAATAPVPAAAVDPEAIIARVRRRIRRRRSAVLIGSALLVVGVVSADLLWRPPTRVEFADPAPPSAPVLERPVSFDVIAETTRSGSSWAISPATTPTAYADLWTRLGFDGPPPTVDLDHRVVLFLQPGDDCAGPPESVTLTGTRLLIESATTSACDPAQQRAVHAIALDRRELPWLSQMTLRPGVDQLSRSAVLDLGPPSEPGSGTDIAFGTEPTWHVRTTGGLRDVLQASLDGSWREAMVLTARRPIDLGSAMASPVTDRTGELSLRFLDPEGGAPGGTLEADRPARVGLVLGPGGGTAPIEWENAFYTNPPVGRWTFEVPLAEGGLELTYEVVSVTGADLGHAPVTPVAPSTLVVPPVGETRADVLDDGTPVFVAHSEDGDVHVVEAFGSHRPAAYGRMVGWCPQRAAFQEPTGGSRWAVDGDYLFGPAPHGLVTYAAEARDDEILVARRNPPRPRWATDAGPATDAAEVVAGEDPEWCPESDQPDLLHPSYVAHDPAAWPLLPLEGLPGQVDGWHRTTAAVFSTGMGEDPAVLCPPGAASITAGCHGAPEPAPEVRMDGEVLVQLRGDAVVDVVPLPGTSSTAARVDREPVVHAQLGVITAARAPAEVDPGSCWDVDCSAGYLETTVVELLGPRGPIDVPVDGPLPPRTPAEGVAAATPRPLTGSPIRVDDPVLQQSVADAALVRIVFRDSVIVRIDRMDSGASTAGDPAAPPVPELPYGVGIDAELARVLEDTVPWPTVGMTSRGVDTYHLPVEGGAVDVTYQRDVPGTSVEEWLADRAVEHDDVRDVAGVPVSVIRRQPWVQVAFPFAPASIEGLILTYRPAVPFEGEEGGVSPAGHETAEALVAWAEALLAAR